MSASVNRLTEQMFHAEQRRAERDDVFFPTRIFLADADADADVVNLSPFGFMARAEVIAPERTKVQLALPLIGKIEALVIWSLGGRIGGEFTKPIDVAEYRRILAASRLLRRRWPHD